MITDYLQSGQREIGNIAVRTIDVGHSAAQLHSLTVRAGRARHAMEAWRLMEKGIYLGSYLHGTDVARHLSARYPVHELDLSSTIDGDELTALCDAMRGCIVILNSNDVDTARLLQLLYVRCPETLFVGTLYDNHHALEACATIGMCCDMVYPAHFDNLALINRYCPYVRGPLPASTIQWSQRQAAELEPLIYSTSRTTDLSGGFSHYPDFRFRAAIVETVMAQPVGSALEMPAEGTPQHHARRSKEENWRVWCGSKANLMVPTLTDLPHRFFDALLTGNVPLVPRYLAPFMDRFDFSSFAELPFVWFDYADLPDMAPLVARACAKFDREGAHGIAQRHLWVRGHHMLEHRLDSILDDVRHVTDNILT
jgi:hypothetical protein